MEVECLPVGVCAEHHVRPMFPDRANDEPPELGRVLQCAVGIPQVDHLLHAQGLRGVGLLNLAYLGQTLRRHFRIAGALVAVGAQNVNDLGALLDPLGYGPAAAAFPIVGMRNDHHSPVRSVYHVL